MKNPHYKLRPLKDKDNLQQIYLVYSHKGKELRIPMKYKVPSIYWKDGRVIGKIKDIDLDAVVINNELDENITYVNSIITDYRKKDMNVNPDTEYVRQKYYSNDPTKNGENTLLYYYSEYIVEKEKDGKCMTRYNNLKKDIELFLGTKVDKTFLKDVNNNFLNDFKNNMMNREIIGKKKGQSNGVIKKKFGYFKTFLNSMKIKKLNVPDDYKYFKLGTLVDPEQHLILLEEKELETFRTLELPDYLSKVRDMYLVGCYTGLRFSDILALNKTKVRKVKTESGETVKYLEVTPIKTRKQGTIVTPPLNGKCESILERNGWKFSKITNQCANRFLREALSRCEIPRIKEQMEMIIRNVGDRPEKDTKELYKFIHFHSSRAYFITYCLDIGMKIPDIMNWSGHKDNFDVFQRYIDSKTIRISSVEKFIKLS